MRRLWRDYGLSLALAMLFLASWALQTVTGRLEFSALRRADGLDAEMFGPDGYVWPSATSTWTTWTHGHTWSIS